MSRFVKIAGLCLASMLLVGMALAGTANAGPLWLVCLEGSGLTKYTSNQCTTAGTGNWQSLGVPAGVTDTVTVRAFSLRLTDLKAGPLKEKAVVKCNGTGSEGKGIIESGGKGQITEAKVENAKTNCERVEGPCKAGEVEAVEGANLPWKTEIFEESGKFLTKILKHSGGGEPGWKVTCNTLLKSKTDECLSESETLAEKVELISEKTGSSLLVRGRFETANPAKCSEGGAKTGEIAGLVAILLTSGNGLSINGV